MIHVLCAVCLASRGTRCSMTDLHVQPLGHNAIAPKLNIGDAFMSSVHDHLPLQLRSVRKAFRRLLSPQPHTHIMLCTAAHAKMSWQTTASSSKRKRMLYFATNTLRLISGSVLV